MEEGWKTLGKEERGRVKEARRGEARDVAAAAAAAAAALLYALAAASQVANPPLAH